MVWGLGLGLVTEMGNTKSNMGTLHIVAEPTITRFLGRLLGFTGSSGTPSGTSGSDAMETLGILTILPSLEGVCDKPCGTGVSVVAGPVVGPISGVSLFSMCLLSSIVPVLFLLPLP